MWSLMSALYFRSPGPTRLSASWVCLLLAVLVACAATAAGAPLLVSEKTISITSNLVNTRFVLQTDASLSNRVSINALLSGPGAPAVQIEELLSNANGVITVKPNPAGQVNAAPRSGPFTFLISTIAAIATFILRPKIGSAVVGVGIIAVAFQAAQALESFQFGWTVEVTISMPPANSYQLDSLTLSASKGSVSGNDGNFKSLSINLCSDSGNTINLVGPMISQSGSFCSSGAAALSAVSASATVSLSVRSTASSASLSLQGSFAGSYNVSASSGLAATTLNQGCTASSDTVLIKSGSCGSGLASVVVVGAQSASFSTGVAPPPRAAPAPVPGSAPVAPPPPPAGALRWSSPATWPSNQLPQAGQDVVIPTGATIIMDVTTPELGQLDVQGTLIADYESDFWISATTIRVLGAIKVGSPQFAFARSGRFTLTGAKSTYTSRAPFGGFSNDRISRGFLVEPGAVLEFYGSAPATRATRLNAHAAVNATVLTLESTDGIRVGSQVVISCTVLVRTCSSDLRTVTAVNGNTITVDRGLSYPRWGRLQYMTDSGISLTPGTYSAMRAHPDVADILDERAVVLNLDRNIIIEGKNDTHWSNGHGVHVMWMGRTTRVQLDGVEVRRCGQAGALGRYCLHAHMQSYNMPDGPDLPSDGSFVGFVDVTIKNSAVHQSVNRAIVVHGTCGMKVHHNVIYDVLGHAIFLEDGSEVLNEIVGNTVLNVRSPTRANALLLHDIGPGYDGVGASGIWFTNPNNTLKFNVVGDIRNGPGIWNAFHRKIDNADYNGGCLGQSRKVRLFPFNTPTLDYSTNTAFSCRGPGALTDHFVIDEYGNTASAQFVAFDDSQPGEPYNNPRQVPHVFDRMILWMNMEGAYRNRIFDPLYTRWIVADNIGTFLNGATTKGAVERALFIGTSLNNLDPSFPINEIHAFATYHHSIGFRHLSFFNFPSGNQAPTAGYGLLNVNGVSESWDYYLTPVEMGTRFNTNWRMFNVSQFERTPPAHIEQLWEGNAGGPDSTMSGIPVRRYWTLSGALYDNEGLLGGRHGDYLIYDYPFLTYNLTNMRRLTPSGKTVATSDKFLGLSVWATDSMVNRYQYTQAITFARVDQNWQDLPQLWQIKDGGNSSFLGWFRHAAMVSGGRYRVYNQDIPTPNSVRYNMIISNGNGPSDTVIIGIPWSGTVQPGVHAGSTLSGDRASDFDVTTGKARRFTQVASRAELVASSNTFWRDTATNQLWISFIGGYVKHASDTAEDQEIQISIFAA